MSAGDDTAGNAAQHRLNGDVATPTVTAEVEMLFNRQFIAVALLAGGIGQVPPNNTTREPQEPDPCDLTFVVGHVPGHMDRVWELRGCELITGGE